MYSTIIFYLVVLYSVLQNFCTILFSSILCIPFFRYILCYLILFNCNEFRSLDILWYFVLFSYFSDTFCVFFFILYYCKHSVLLYFIVTHYSIRFFTYIFLYSVLVISLEHSNWFITLILQWCGPGNHPSIRTQISSSPSASPSNWRTCRASTWACLISTSESSVSLTWPRSLLVQFSVSILHLSSRHQL